MRTVLVTNIVSLDGYFDGPGRSMLLLNMDASFDEGNLERMSAADLIVVGPRSFELFGSYWPPIADAPEDPSNPALDAANRGISRAWRDARILVVADDYAVPTEHPWASHTEVVAWADIEARIAAERDAGDGDILVIASRTTWNRMLDLGLIDELHLTISPTVVGDGVPVFDHPRGAPVGLKLLGADRPDGSDNVVLRYSTAV